MTTTSTAGRVNAPRTVSAKDTHHEAVTPPGVPARPAEHTTGAGGGPGEGAAPAPAQPVRFAVLGQPVPQGSITSLGKGRPAVHSNARTLKPWRKAVAQAAADTMAMHDQLSGPVEVWLRFAFDRPLTHYRTGRFATLLRDLAPRCPANRGSGDLDKLTRAVLDAITGTVLVDDAQVVDLRCSKRWAGENERDLQVPGVRIEVRPVTA